MKQRRGRAYNQKRFVYSVKYLIFVTDIVTTINKPVSHRVLPEEQKLTSIILDVLLSFPGCDITHP